MKFNVSGVLEKSQNFLDENICLRYPFEAQMSLDYVLKDQKKGLQKSGHRVLLSDANMNS